MNLYSPKDLSELIEKNGFFFKKNLGQNFLVNEAVAERIASSSLPVGEKNKKTAVIEIGPGAGALTKKLSEIYDRVISVEIDRHAIPLLEETLAGAKNVEIINADALNFDYSALAEKYTGYDFVSCSNLPYCITSEAIMTLAESALGIKSITVLIQKEAAERLTAAPGTREYGAVTVALSYRAVTKKLFNVGPANFIPRPKVDSSVIKIEMLPVPSVSVKDEKLFFKIVRAAFGSRRKTLTNALYPLFDGKIEKDAVSKIISDAGILPERRGETLSPKEFAALSDIFSKEMNG